MEIKYSLKDFDKGQIENQFNMQSGGRVELFQANTCFRRMQKYTPFDTGALSTTATIRPGKIIYEMPYAHRQYTSNKGKGIRGKEWDKKMWNAEKDIVVKEVSNYMAKIQGGK